MELPILFRDTYKDTYEDYILTKKGFQPPDDFIDIFIKAIVATDAYNDEAITLSPLDSL